MRHNPFYQIRSSFSWSVVLHGLFLIAFLFYALSFFFPAYAGESAGIGGGKAKVVLLGKDVPLYWFLVGLGPLVSDGFRSETISAQVLTASVSANLFMLISPLFWLGLWTKPKWFACFWLTWLWPALACLPFPLRAIGIRYADLQIGYYMWATSILTASLLLFSLSLTANKGESQ